jgi:sarcosine oxidase
MHYDAIVLGVGGMGSATCFELARRGRRVLGLEQFPLVHDRGSSHGRTRIIRTAYYEHPAYVPLVRRAFERWLDLEQLSGKHLLTACPCLSIGTPESEVIRGVKQAADEHRLVVEGLTADDLRKRFPPFRFSDQYVGLLEQDSGFLYVEECVRAYIDAACWLRADIRADEPVVEWHAEGSGVVVRTAKASYHAAQLVVTAGPWAAGLLGRYGARLSVMRQVPMWFATDDDRLFRRDRFPLFIAETREGAFYGFPVIDADGLKVARHYGAPELSSPSEVSSTVRDDDEIPVRRFLVEHIPSASGARRRSSVCIYTLSPDRHFIIDLHPEYRQVALAAGFSGHGFKFASVVGEVLADLAERGTTELPVEMFRIGRFGRGGDGVRG